MRRRKVLLVQRSLQPPGGGNAVAAWMLQALAPWHDVTVLSWDPVEVEAIDRFFGTSLAGTRFTNIGVSRWLRAAAETLPVPGALARSAWLMRCSRRVAGDYEVILGAHNEMDFGRRGIQYVHYPTYLRPRPAADLRWYHAAPVLRAYYLAADLAAGFSLARMKQNLTLANSDWTAARVRASLGSETRTVYPPVMAPATLPAWSQRRSHFLAIGRGSPEKEYERIIRILARVRSAHPEVQLTIVGTWDARGRRYRDRVHAVAASVDPGRKWISFLDDLPQEELRTLIAGSRFGVHGMRAEHFGMAPAEMVAGGMIVWVPNDGGQVEIVGDEPLLRYDSEEEAAGKILHVLNDAHEQARLRQHLAAQSARFGVDRFVREIQEIVDTFEP